jgi:hypothetical protein
MIESIVITLGIFLFLSLWLFIKTVAQKHHSALCAQCVCAPSRNAPLAQESAVTHEGIYWFTVEQLSSEAVRR